MKTLSRDFTLRERVLIILLSVILLGMCYYQFVDVPVRTAINSAHAERDSLQMELESVRIQVQQVEQMKSELDEIEESGRTSRMESYNNSKAELALLNDILASASDYTITFAEVTRDKDQIRRDFSLQFVAQNYGTVEKILAELARSPSRCLVGDIFCTGSSRTLKDQNITVNLTATFYETMVGGVEDAGLPADTDAQNEDEGITYEELAS